MRRQQEKLRDEAQNLVPRFRIWPEEIWGRDEALVLETRTRIWPERGAISGNQSANLARAKPETSFRSLAFGRSRSTQETPWRGDSWIAEDLGLAPSVVKKQRERLRDEARGLETRARIWPEKVWGRDDRWQRYSERESANLAEYLKAEEIGFETTGQSPRRRI